MTGRLGPGRRAITIACLAVVGCTPSASDGSGAPSRSADPVPPASPSSQPTFVRPTPNPSPTFLVHEVVAGESLTSIARAYGTTARSIAFWNRDQYPSLDPDSDGYVPDRIVVGWTLRLIPTAVVDEEELPEPTATPTPASASPPASPSIDPGSASPSSDASPA